MSEEKIKFTIDFKKILLNPIRSLIKSQINFKSIKSTLNRIFSNFKDELIYFFAKPQLKWIDINVKGFLNFNQAKALYNLAKKLDDNSIIVEIGAYYGRSTCFLGEAIKKKKIYIYSIDTFENQAMSEGLKNTYSEYYKNIYPYREKIKIVKGFSYDVVKKLRDLNIDLLWLDADHSYEACLRDIIDWYPLVSYNGFMVFHDYYLHKFTKGVKKAVDEMIKTNKLKPIKLRGYLLITRKI